MPGGTVRVWNHSRSRWLAANSSASTHVLHVHRGDLEAARAVPPNGRHFVEPFPRRRPPEQGHRGLHPDIGHLRPPRSAGRCAGAMRVGRAGTSTPPPAPRRSWPRRSAAPTRPANCWCCPPPHPGPRPAPLLSAAAGAAAGSGRSENGPCSPPHPRRPARHGRTSTSPTPATRSVQRQPARKHPKGPRHPGRT